MARARAKRNRQQNEIAEVIIAEWFRLLDTAEGADGKMDVGSLTAALNEILDVPCEAIEDGVEIVKIVVPRPPRKTKAALQEYLDKNRDFVPGMSAAALFGCGR
jgi:hypothetical protein